MGTPETDNNKSRPKQVKVTREQQRAAERTSLAILRYVLDHPTATRKDTASFLHLSYPNVCRLVTRFQEQGVLVEEELKQTGKRGPQSKTLCLRADLGCTIGVDLESTHIRAIALDFANEIRGVYRRPITVDIEPGDIVPMVAEAAGAMFEKACEENLPVCAVGLALPGPVVDESRGRIRTELQGGTADLEFTQAVRDKCGVATYATANDLCFALGHHRMHPPRDNRVEMLVLNRFGLSAVLVRGEQLYTGNLGLLPYGSELPMRHYRDVCTGAALLRLARSHGDTRQFQDLMSSPADPLVAEWLSTATPAFAEAIYSAAMMYSPNQLIIEGIFSKLPKQVRANMTKLIEEEITRLGMKAPKISFFEGDDLMGARGAAFTARDRIAEEVITDIMQA